MARAAQLSLDAVVFLDSALEYAGFDAPQFSKLKAAVERNPKSSVPVIFFADRERHPKLEALDPYLKFAARFEIGTPALEHNAFVSQGAVGKSESERRTYEAICDAILTFLDAHLRGDASALQRLHRAGTEGPLHLRYRPGAPVPPTGAQLARLYLTDAPAGGQALGALMKIAEVDVLISAASILFDSNEKKQAVELLKSASRAHAHSTAIAVSLAEALQQTGDPTGATAAYDKALALLPADDTLSATQKAELRKSIEEARKK